MNLWIDDDGEAEASPLLNHIAFFLIVIGVALLLLEGV